MDNVTVISSGGSEIRVHRATPGEPELVILEIPGFKDSVPSAWAELKYDAIIDLIITLTEALKR